MPRRGSSRPPIKVLTVFGTRPEAIKLAPVIKALEKNPNFISRVAVTAQHRQMLDQVLELYDIKPDEDLNIMLRDQTLFQITTRALLGLEELIAREKPDLILVQGDTTTTFAASLASFYYKIRFGHVEAGLRTDDKYQPFPEEMNRRLTTVLTDMHFAPTKISMKNLLANGVAKKSIYLTGNTVTDALQGIIKKVGAYQHPVVANLNHGTKLLLVEAHRRENLGKPMEDVCAALLKLVRNFPDANVVFSVHKNPRVQETVYGMLHNKERIFLVDPMDYPTLVDLQKRAYLILTDSGGIQEEAPSLGKPVLVLRNTTERPEGIMAGVAKLVGTDEQKIYGEAAKLLTSKQEYARMSRVANPYGDGKASQRIVDAILHVFGRRRTPPSEFRG